MTKHDDAERFADICEAAARKLLFAGAAMIGLALLAQVAKLIGSIGL